MNGVPRGKVVWLKGQNIRFRISGRPVQDRRAAATTSRSRRTAPAPLVLDGDPDAVGDTGHYAIGDAAFVPLPAEATKSSFGVAEVSTSSSQSVKIQP